MFRTLPALCMALALVSMNAGAQTRPGMTRDLGKVEYETNCASCHGLQGKGDGPLKPWLTRSPSDLTMLARRNGGVLPVSRIYEVIDGSSDQSVHGSRDMPVWGNEYRLRAGEHFGGDMPYDPESYVRARILTLVDYVARIQSK